MVGPKYRTVHVCQYMLSTVLLWKTLLHSSGWLLLKRLLFIFDLNCHTPEGNLNLTWHWMTGCFHYLFFIQSATCGVLFAISPFTFFLQQVDGERLGGGVGREAELFRRPVRQREWVTLLMLGLKLVLSLSPLETCLVTQGRNQCEGQASRIHMEQNK